MSSEFQEMLDLMGKPGVTVMQFCGISVDDDNFCDQEAVGEVLAELEDGVTLPIPICEGHLRAVQAQYTVEELNT
ncbi:hypothetical protein SEA_BILLNYE_103 [Streptomyces phage BillNye]|uniref:Uncharacterized protein n=2 Tax=Wilnyevirus billnye TaxID=2560486 RepID=A0A2L1IVV7_9CAUD|nr:hypothetical protein FDJ30_gp137 [Streptomyces phage BillNye]AVD99296.1 hypothetical protein SEA_BILLNYE_103 [Streptomyces phage BillNye]QBZ72379.1 hypothetical protein SEA_CIRCINUS_104 [Streptomyces phage Circinus]